METGINVVLIPIQHPCPVSRRFCFRPALYRVVYDHQVGTVASDTRADTYRIKPAAMNAVPLVLLITVASELKAELAHQSPGLSAECACEAMVIGPDDNSL